MELILKIISFVVGTIAYIALGVEINYMRKSKYNRTKADFFAAFYLCTAFIVMMIWVFK